MRHPAVTTSMSSPPKPVFLSYARSTSAGPARALHAALGPDTAFLDEQDIEKLEEFPRVLTDALLAARLVVVFADATYFQRWYCLREWLLARAPWLAARKSGGDARRALEHLLVVLPGGGLSADDLARLPIEAQSLNLPSAADVAALAKTVRLRLAQVTLTLEERYAAFSVPAATRALLADPLVIPRAPKRLGKNGNTDDLRPTLGDAFVGRADELWTLHDVLSTLRGDSKAVAVTGALQGGGGFGKTRLAVEYVYRYGPSSYPGGLFWLDASEPSLLSGGLRKVLAALSAERAPTLPESELRSTIRDELLSRVQQRGEILFVVDNLPEAPTGEAPQPLEHYCPALGEVTCLLTSRVLQGYGREIANLSVQVLQREASIRLLQQGVEGSALTDDDWAHIADWVGHLPLALEILNGSLRQAGVPANELLELAKKSRDPAHELDTKVAALRGQVPEKDLRGITQAFELSLARLSEAARELALDCAWLAPAPIPQAVLRARTTPATLDVARTALVGRSFLTPLKATKGTPDSLQMHRVLASYLRGQEEGTERALRMWHALVSFFDREEIEAGREDRALLSSLVPHVNWLFDRKELHPSLTPSACLRLSDHLDSFGVRVTDAAPIECAMRLARAFSGVVDTETRGWANAALGNALQHLGLRESDSARLEEAVIAYRAALEVRTRENLPLWARSQSNLGTALQSLGQRKGDSVRLEEAVTAYRAALEVHTKDRLPLDWAAIENNLGNALASLGESESDLVRLEEAVIAYRAALEVYTREKLPLDWAMTQNNLGAVLRGIGQRSDDSVRLEEAVNAHRAALVIHTREKLPLDWATTQDNLGNALAILGEREGDSARLEEGVAAYRAALEIRTKEKLPLHWGTTQNNLGNALASLGEREVDSTWLEEAVAAYRAALEVFDLHVPAYRDIVFKNLRRALDRLGRGSSERE